MIETNEVSHVWNVFGSSIECYSSDGTEMAVISDSMKTENTKKYYFWLFQFPLMFEFTCLLYPIHEYTLSKISLGLRIHLHLICIPSCSICIFAWMTCRWENTCNKLPFRITVESKTICTRRNLMQATVTLVKKGKTSLLWPKMSISTHLTIVIFFTKSNFIFHYKNILVHF